MRGVNTNPNALAKCLAAPEPNFAVLPFAFAILVFSQRGNFLSRRFHKNITYRFVYAALCIYACVSSLAKKYSLLRECIIKRITKTDTNLRYMGYIM